MDTKSDAVDNAGGSAPSASKLLSLHSRKMYSFEEAMQQLPLKLLELQEKCAKWTKSKADFEELNKLLGSTKEDLTLQKRTQLMHERAALFNQLRSSREELQNEEKQLTALEGREEELAYMTKAIPFLNACHKYRNELQLLEKGGDGGLRHVQKLSLQHELDELTKEYIREFFPQMAKQKAVRMEVDIPDGTPCPHCKKGKVESSICNGCSANFEVDHAQTHDSLTYEQMRSLTPQRQFTYRRINHFREYLRQVQGKSRACIPAEIFDMLRAEFSKSKVPVEKIVPRLVRAKLKKLRKPKYYEHIESIAHALNRSYRPINIEPAREEKLCFMFTQLEVPYEQVKKQVKKTRKNFMSYPYVFYKLCELLAWDEYLHASQLLKSVTLLVEQDKWWMLVTSKLAWQFVGRTADMITKR